MASLGAESFQQSTRQIAAVLSGPQSLTRLLRTTTELEETSALIVENSYADPMKPILAAGLTCFVLDGCSALIQSWYLSGKTPNPERVFQSVAFGLLGPDTYKMGVSSFLLGLLVHLIVAMGAATVFYALSRFVPFLIDQALIAGVLYGAAVHFFMQYATIPLSKIGPRPFNARSFYSGLIIHVIVVGPSIALMTAAMVKRSGR